MIADGIGLPMDKVIIVQNPTGGTFGYKFSPTIEALLAVAAIDTGKPVYLEFNIVPTDHIHWKEISILDAFKIRCR